MDLKERRNAARYKRLRHRIKHMHKMEKEKMNFSPIVLEVYENIDAYVNLLERDASVLRCKTDTCTWTQDDAGDWDTSCGECFIFNDGGPKDNHFEHCPYCGKSLEEKPWKGAKE